MREAAARLFVEGLKSANINLLTVLADSWLFEPYRQAKADQFFSVVPVANEGEGVGICAGAWLGGKKSAILMENSGLRTACEPLARLQGIPVLLLIAYRGHVGDGVWWLEPLGERLGRVLDAMDVRYTVVERTEDIPAAVRDALATMEMAKEPVAVLFRREAVRA